MSKLITVFGATGQQGGSVAAQILNSPELSKLFRVRAVTRDTTKPAALKLKEKGAEVVKADMNDAASVAEAVKGADAVFGVTNFWEGMDGSSELKQGKAIADAAVAQGVKQIIFSTLPNVTRVTNGHLKHVSHFDSKAHIEEYIKTLSIQSAFFWPAFYMQNFANPMFGPQPSGDGTYTWTSILGPNDKMPLIDITDSGKYITPALLEPEKWNQKRVYGATAFYSPNQIVETLTKGSGKTVKYQQVPDDGFRAALPPAMAAEMTENMILIRDYKYFGPEDQGAEQELLNSLAEVKETPTTFEKYVSGETWFQ